MRIAKANGTRGLGGRGRGGVVGIGGRNWWEGLRGVCVAMGLEGCRHLFLNEISLLGVSALKEEGCCGGLIVCGIESTVPRFFCPEWLVVISHEHRGQSMSP